MTTNIEDKHKDAFESIRDKKSAMNYALFSCFVNGEPAAAIVNIYKRNGEYHIYPLFVSVTPGMKITDHDGNEPTKLD